MWPGPDGWVGVAAFAMPAMPTAAPPMMPAETIVSAKVRAMLMVIVSSPVRVDFSVSAPVCSGDEPRMPWPATVVCPQIGRRSGGIACPPIGRTRLASVSQIPAITLNDGISIRQVGFGTYKVDPAQTAEAVRTALEVGYRHVDTAQMYKNERGVGRAIREVGIDRADVHVTSKLDNSFHKPDDARRAFDDTLNALGSDYVDLFLIHWPLPMHYGGDFVSTWRTLEEFKRDGRARSIGVSNFEIAHLERLLDEAETVPAVNQIEAHPYLLNDRVRTFG